VGLRAYLGYIRYYSHERLLPEKTFLR